MKYDPESYLLSVNDFRLVSGTLKEKKEHNLILKMIC